MICCDVRRSTIITNDEPTIASINCNDVYMQTLTACLYVSVTVTVGA